MTLPRLKLTLLSSRRWRTPAADTRGSLQPTWLPRSPPVPAVPHRLECRFFIREMVKIADGPSEGWNSSVTFGPLKALSGGTALPSDDTDKHSMLFLARHWLAANCPPGGSSAARARTTAESRDRLRISFCPPLGSQASAMLFWKSAATPADRDFESRLLQQRCSSQNGFVV